MKKIFLPVLLFLLALLSACGGSKTSAEAEHPHPHDLSQGAFVSEQDGFSINLPRIPCKRTAANFEDPKIITSGNRFTWSFDGQALTVISLNFAGDDLVPARAEREELASKKDQELFPNHVEPGKVENFNRVDFKGNPAYGYEIADKKTNKRALMRHVYTDGHYYVITAMHDLDKPHLTAGLTEIVNSFMPLER